MQGIDRLCCFANSSEYVPPHLRNSGGFNSQPPAPVNENGNNTYYNSSKISQLLPDGVLVAKEIKDVKPDASEQNAANYAPSNQQQQFNGNGNGNYKNNNGGGYHNKGQQNNNNNPMWQQQQQNGGGNRYNNNRNGGSAVVAAGQNGAIMAAPAGAPVNAQVPVVPPQVPMNQGANQIPQPDR